MPLALLIAFVLFASACVLVHLQRRESSRTLTLFLIATTLFSVWIYTDFGKFNWLPKHNDEEYIAATGSKDKRALFHWHEIYHYYLGAKYYKEVTYDGLYETVLLADQQTSPATINVPRIRDLSDPTRSISREEALQRAASIYRPRFTDARWDEFKRDWSTMKNIAHEGWGNLAMFDAGFNPPPSWNVIGYTVANLIPISRDWFSYPPTFDQVELLPYIDVLLMLIASVFLFRSFGVIGLCAFWIVFATSFLSAMSWTAGSFFRHLWLFGLILGICEMHKEHWFRAGFWLGFAFCMRIFPLVFVGGAGLWLLYRWYKNRESWRDLKRFSLGVITVCALLVGVSLLMFGFEYWGLFFRKINEHKDLFFVWHIGFRRIAVFADWVPYQDFWWAEGLERFRGWNERLQQSWQSQRWFQLPFAGLLIALAALAGTRLKAVESTLLTGAVGFFMLAIPANYYYAFYALIPLAFLTAEKRYSDSLLLFTLFTLWAVIFAMPQFGGDDMIKNYRMCIAIFVFLLFWLALRLGKWLPAPQRYARQE